MIPVLTRESVEPLLDWIALTEALRAGHRRPPAQIEDVLLARGDDRLLSRAAWIEGMGVGVKSVIVVPGNAARGLPSIHGAMLIFNDTTGEIEAVIDNALITRWKTAADSLLGARLLARPESERYLIIGAGSVAASLIEAFRAWKPALQISVWARRPEAAQALADSHGVTAAQDLPSAVAEAEIISTCTMARDPVLKGDWLQPGQHIDLIGAYTPDMREADDRAMQRARIFVDSRATTLSHIGELMMPLASGAITETDVLGDLHQLASGEAARLTKTEITLFKNGGGAHLDLMTARMMLARWRESQR